MTFNEYQNEVLRTYLDADGNEASALYFCTCLAEEIGEIAHRLLLAFKNGTPPALEDEIGDVLWCLTALGQRFNISLAYIAVSKPDQPMSVLCPPRLCPPQYRVGELQFYRWHVKLSRHVGEVFRMIKRADRHGFPIDRDALCAGLGRVLDQLALVGAEGVTIEKAAAANVAKIRNRYPDGFYRRGE